MPRLFLNGNDLVDAPLVETVTAAEEERFSPDVTDIVDVEDMLLQSSFVALRDFWHIMLRQASRSSLRNNS